MMREAYAAALQFEHIAYQILEKITPLVPELADALSEYTRKMLRCMRRGPKEGLKAAVWMVEVLIVLDELRDAKIEPALITAATEILERIEEELREEGSLPPAR
jgi:hypothetical protein